MNRIVTGLKSGVLQAARAVLIPEGVPYYIVEFSKDRAGLFTRFSKSTSERVYFYTEMAIKNGKVVHKSPIKSLMSITSLNNFFKVIIDHNHKLAMENKPLSEDFVLAIHFFDHNKHEMIEVDLNNYAPSLEQKNKVSFCNMYLKEQLDLINSW